MDTVEKCYQCGGEARPVREPREVAVGSRVIVVDHEFMRCGTCGVEYYLPGGMEAAQRLAATEVRKSEGLMMPEEIRALRESVGLSQAQFEKVLNVGPKTVVRWEKGTVFQSGGINTLLLALRARPDLLPIIAQANGVELPNFSRTTVGKREGGPADLRAAPGPQGAFTGSQASNPNTAGASRPPSGGGLRAQSWMAIAAMIALAVFSGLIAGLFVAKLRGRQAAYAMMARMGDTAEPSYDRAGLGAPSYRVIVCADSTKSGQTAQAPDKPADPRQPAREAR